MTIKRFINIVSKCNRYYGLLGMKYYIKLDWSVAKLALKNRWIYPENTHLICSRKHGNRYCLNVDEFSEFSGLVGSKFSNIFANCGFLNGAGNSSDVSTFYNQFNNSYEYHEYQQPLNHSPFSGSTDWCNIQDVSDEPLQNPEEQIQNMRTHLELENVQNDDED